MLKVIFYVLYTGLQVFLLHHIVIRDLIETERHRTWQMAFSLLCLLINLAGIAKTCLAPLIGLSFSYFTPHTRNVIAMFANAYILSFWVIGVGSYVVRAWLFSRHPPASTEATPLELDSLR